MDTSFLSKLLPIFSRYSSVQTAYKSSQVTWKISWVNKERSTQLLSLTKTPLTSLRYSYIQSVKYKYSLWCNNIETESIFQYDAYLWF